VSAGGTTEWVERAPRQSPAMKAAYKGLADAERYVAECHADGDWEAHHEAVDIYVGWHHQVAIVAQEERR
jgi:hypothetical protein